MESMLRAAASSLRVDNGRAGIHQMLFTILAELLPTEVMNDNITIVMDMLRKCLESDNLTVQQSALNIINTLLNSKYTIEDIKSLIEHKYQYERHKTKNK